MRPSRGGERGGNPPPSSLRSRRATRDRGETPKHDSAGPHRAVRTRTRKGVPRPSRALNPYAGRRGRGPGPAHTPHASRGRRKRGIPPNGSVRSQRTACTDGGRGGEPEEVDAEEGAPPEQRALLAHSMQGRRGVSKPKEANRGPPEQHARPAHGVSAREGGGADQDAEGAALPDQRAI